jgi:NAD(P)-dependent dehydrogenase (short-subunit alcohol dehydrogenase family)
MDDYGARATTPPAAIPFRMVRCIWRQRARTPRCPDAPRLDGKLAVVTGGNAGIGLEISRGLAVRGAEVIIAARNAKTAGAACDAIARESKTKLTHVPLDLSDLASVRAAIDAIGKRHIDVLVANAGVAPRKHATSAQGHEIAFAVNTLGHYMLVTRLLPRLSRAVIVTGDIYMRVRECTSDFTYGEAGGLSDAYCRSKLGNLWFVAELHTRHPDVEVCAVHPGVVASGLGGEAEADSFFRRRIMIDCVAGAQTPLWCATQPIESGAYYHNTMGKMLLRQKDPARDDAKASALWERMEQLVG